MFFCLLFGALGGCCTTVGVNILQYKKHAERCGTATFSAAANTAVVVLNFVCSGGSVVFFVLATKYGPVSVAMPIVTGTSLVANMILQILLGIEKYSKSMRVGTWVLFAAVVCLIDVGPKDQLYEDPLGLLFTGPGMLISAFQLALILGSLASVYSLRDEGPSSIAKIFSYAIVVAATTAVGASLSKLMQLELPPLVKWSAVLGYFVCGVFSFGGAAIAATVTDAAIYLPVRCCVQLILNAFTGICVWQDRIESWTAYTAVYILVVLGVYSVSTLDLAGNGEAASSRDLPYVEAVDRLAGVWLDRGASTQETSEALREVLDRGLQSGNVEPSAVVDLAMELFEKCQQAGPTPSLTGWAQSNVNLFSQYYVVGEEGPVPRASLTQGRYAQSKSEGAVELRGRDVVSSQPTV